MSILQSRYPHPTSVERAGVCFFFEGVGGRGYRVRLDIIGRYETRLWRQMAQTILLINPENVGKFSYSDTRATHFFSLS